MKNLFFLNVLFFSGLVFANTRTELIGNLSHGDQGNVITLGYSYDAISNVTCIHGGITRSGGAAATAIDCFPAGSPGLFRIEKLSSLTHPDSNEITIFKVSQTNSTRACYGNAMTRSGNIIYDKQGGKMAGAGAALSLKCQ